MDRHRELSPITDGDDDLLRAPHAAINDVAAWGENALRGRGDSGSPSPRRVSLPQASHADARASGESGPLVGEEYAPREPSYTIRDSVPTLPGSSSRGPSFNPWRSPPREVGAGERSNSGATESEAAPTTAAYSAGSPGAKELERQRSELATERLLIERDREKLEELLCRYRRPAASSAELPAPTADDAAGGSCDERYPSASVSPIHSAPEGAAALKSRVPSVSSSPSGERARSPQATSPPRRSPFRGLEASPSPVRLGIAGGRAAVGGADTPQAAGEDARGTSTAVVREVQPQLSMVESIDGSSKAASGLAVRSRTSPSASAGTGSVRRQREQTSSDRATVDYGLRDEPARAPKGLSSSDYYERKLNDIRRLARGTDADCRGPSGALEVYRRRGPLVTPHWRGGDAGPWDNADDRPLLPWERARKDVLVGSGLAAPAPLAVRNTIAPVVEHRPRLTWDVERSGNVLISEDGAVCVAEPSRAMRLALREGTRSSTGSPLEPVVIPLYALGTVGVASGAFMFQVRFGRVMPRSAHDAVGGSPSLPARAVGVATQSFRGVQRPATTFVYRSNGTMMVGNNAALFAPVSDTSAAESACAYGRPFGDGDEVTVVLQLSQKSLSFFLNGEPMGVALYFEGAGTPEPLFPVVILADSGDSASLVRPFFA